MQTILVVGATGAQGGAIVKHLSSTSQYNILALTRSATSPHAKALTELSNVNLVISDVPSGYDTNAFLQAAKQADAVLVNTDGFAIGEKAETYWGIRLFQLASRAGVKHFVYSGLDSVGRDAGYDPELYVGHYEGKARVQEWIHAQQDSKMAWTIIRSGPYTDLLSSVMLPSTKEDGTKVFELPLSNGAIPFIDLTDFGKYVHWALSHPQESNRLDLGIAIAHVSGDQVAEAFTAATGKPAAYSDFPIDKWNELRWSAMPNGPDTKVGFQSTTDQSTLGLSWGENFKNWWNLYKASGGDKGLIQRDYELLDRIVPDRTRSLQEWMEKTKYDAQPVQILKSSVDIVV